MRLDEIQFKSLSLGKTLVKTKIRGRSMTTIDLPLNQGTCFKIEPRPQNMLMSKVVLRALS